MYLQSSNWQLISINTSTSILLYYTCTCNMYCIALWFALYLFYVMWRLLYIHVYGFMEGTIKWNENEWMNHCQSFRLFNFDLFGLFPNIWNLPFFQKTLHHAICTPANSNKFNVTTDQEPYQLTTTYELACDCHLVSGSGLLVLRLVRNALDWRDLHVRIIKAATVNHKV
jgi:hypothetical protein